MSSNPRNTKRSGFAEDRRVFRSSGGPIMNSRERVRAALKREPADRIPFWIMGFYEGEATERIKQFLGVDNKDEVSDCLGIDVVKLGKKWSVPERHDSAGRKVGEWGYAAVPYYEKWIYPLEGAETTSEIDSYLWPDLQWLTFPEHSETRRKWLEERFILVQTGPIFCQLTKLMPMEQALIHMKLNPALVDVAVEKITGVIEGMVTRQLDAYGELVDAVRVWDDFATDADLFFSLEDCRRFFLPAWRRVFELIKSRGKYVWFHCCGAMSALIPDLMKIGMDILEPCQVHRPGMAPKRLKSEFGSDLAFYGAVNTQGTLPFGSPDDVRREVRERIRVLGKGGGYIIGPDHTVMKDVPPENIFALYDEAAKLSS